MYIYIKNNNIQDQVYLLLNNKRNQFQRQSFNVKMKQTLIDLPEMILGFEIKEEMARTFHNIWSPLHKHSWRDQTKMS